MQFNMIWNITIGAYRLSLLDSCEVHKSVDLLADTCIIKVPATVYNKALKVEYKGNAEEVESKIKRGDKVIVKLGYDDKLTAEFEGWLQAISTDDGSITFNCEDDLFLLRKAVKDKQFKNADVKTIAQYLLTETGVNLKLNVTLNIKYDKFVISKATAYDVLKKLQDETKGNIYIAKGALNIHPPYIQNHGYVKYSFQKNIEKSDLKYKKADDKKIEVVVENTGLDGKKVTVTSGTTGGDKITINGYGLSKQAMQSLADNEYKRQMYDGYEGSITTWLIPYSEPGFSAQIKDDDYEYKDGWYYATAVTTTFDGSGGGVRKVQLGIKTVGKANG